MRRSTVERRWQVHGLDCAVLLTDMGHRCGYCRVPDDHPWRGLGYTDAVPEAEAADYQERSVDDAGMGGMIAALGGAERVDEWSRRVGWSRRVEGHIAVHGGLTYAGEGPGDLYGTGWWFGFDCAHPYDSPRQWTEDAVAAETERLAEQLSTQPTEQNEGGRE